MQFQFRSYQTPILDSRQRTEVARVLQSMNESFRHDSARRHGRERMNGRSPF